MFNNWIKEYFSLFTSKEKEEPYYIYQTLGQCIGSFFEQHPFLDFPEELLRYLESLNDDNKSIFCEGLLTGMIGVIRIRTIGSGSIDMQKANEYNKKAEAYKSFPSFYDLLKRVASHYERDAINDRSVSEDGF